MEPMLVFDGDCGICTRSARWVEPRLRPPSRVVAWQAIPDLAVHGLTNDDVAAAAYWIDARGVTHRGHRAIAHALCASRAGWPLAGYALLAPPIGWVAAVVYAAVARNRHRLPGSTDACAVPSHPVSPPPEL